MGKRGWVVVAVATALTVSAAGGALAYVNAKDAALTDVPSLMTYCADRQREMAGITPADEAGTTNGGTAYQIVNHVYENTAALPGPQSLAANSNFVFSKSGIQYFPTPAPATGRILTTQYVEYYDAAKTQPMQVRCKLRTLESLNRPVSEKQALDNGTLTSVPWGFGPGTATGVGAAGVPQYANPSDSSLDRMKPCSATNADILSKAWADVADKNAAPYRPEAVGANPANVVVDADQQAATGSEWTQAFAPVHRTPDGVLHVRSGSLYSAVGSVSLADRTRGAFYCTYVVSSYLTQVLDGTITPPAAP